MNGRIYSDWSSKKREAQGQTRIGITSTLIPSQKQPASIHGQNTNKGILDQDYESCQTEWKSPEVYSGGKTAGMHFRKKRESSINPDRRKDSEERMRKICAGQVSWKHSGNSDNCGVRSAKNSADLKDHT